MSRFDRSSTVLAAKRSALTGRIKELGKRPRGTGSGEKRKSEKKVRLFEEHSPEARRVRVSPCSLTPKKEKVGAPAVREGSQLEEEVIVAIEE